MCMVESLQILELCMTLALFAQPAPPSYLAPTETPHCQKSALLDQSITKTSLAWSPHWHDAPTMARAPIWQATAPSARCAPARVPSQPPLRSTHASPRHPSLAASAAHCSPASSPIVVVLGTTLLEAPGASQRLPANPSSIANQPSPTDLANLATALFSPSMAARCHVHLEASRLTSSSL